MGVKQLLLPLGSAVLGAVCFPPWNVWWLAFFAFAPIAYAFRLETKQTASLYFGAYLGGLVFALVCLDWMRTSYDGVGLSGPRALSWFLCAQVAAPSWPLILWIGRNLYKRTNAPLVLLFPLVWTGVEFVRTYYMAIFSETLFPWLQLSMTQAAQPAIVQVADLGGAWAVTFMVAMVNGAIVDLWSGRQLAAATAAFGLTSALLYGHWQLQRPTTEGPTVGLISPVFLDSRQSALPDCDLLLTSEMPLRSRAIIDWNREPFLTVSSGRIPRDVVDNNLKNVFGPIAAAAGVPLFAGCRRYCVENESIRVFNSLALFAPTGYVGAYDKTYLVPWREFLPWLRPEALAAGSEIFDHGNGLRVFDIATPKGDYQVGATICYDTCFPSAYRAANQPDFHVVASCEAADKTRCLQDSIERLAMLRAVECRRSVVRNIEDGLSSVIDPCGRPQQRVDMSAANEIICVGPVPIDGRASLYARWSDWLPIGCLAAITMLLATRGLRRCGAPHSAF